MRKICVVLALLIVFLAVIACNNPTGGDGGSIGGGTPTITNAVAVTGVSLKESTSILVGHTETLYAIVEPENATNKNVTWSSTNTAVATVSADGVVTAVSAGTATIYVATKDGGHQAMCTVTISPKEISVTGVSLKASTSLVVGDTETLYAVVEPDNATNQNVTWSSGDTAVATVSTDGVVTGVKIGTATITVTTVDGEKTASCVVTVSNVAVPVTGISMNKTSAAIVVGGTEELTAIITPSNATNQIITWSSSNATVADVSAAGVVIAKNVGSTNITVTTDDGGKTASCSVIVNPKVITFTVDTISARTYTGSAINPVVTVRDGSTVLTLTTHYTVAYTNNTNAGTATVTVSGVGNYTGSSGSKTFTINKSAGAAISAPTSISSVTTNSITINAVTAPSNGQSVEYARNTKDTAPSSGWQDGTAFTGSNKNTAYYIFARSKENTNYNAGTPSASFQVYTSVDDLSVAQWARTVSNTGNSTSSSFNSVAVDGSGNVYAVGSQGGTDIYTYGPGVTAQGSSEDYGNAVLVKYNSDGTAQWARTVSTGNDGSVFNSVAVDSSGNIYAAGFQTGNGTYTYGSGVTAQGSSVINAVLVKYNSNGTAQWARTVSTTASTERTRSEFNSVAVDASNNVYAAGYQTGNGTYTYGSGVTVKGSAGKYEGSEDGRDNAVLVKYNSSGTAQWARTVSTGNDSSAFNSVAVDASNNVYTAGYQSGNGTYTYGSGVTAQGTYDGHNYDGSSNDVLVKYNSTGTAQWAKVSTINYRSSFSSVAVDRSGSIYAARYYAAVLIKYASNGIMQWEQEPDVPYFISPVLYSVAVDGSGNEYGTGRFFSASPDNLYEGELRKYNSNGTVQWGRRVNTGSASFYSVAVDASGNVYTVGKCSNGATFGSGVTAQDGGAVLVKYKQ